MVAARKIIAASGVFPESGYVSIADAGIILAPVGEPSSYHAVYAWIHRGVVNAVGKRVRLKATKLPSGYAISAHDLAAFARALNGDDGNYSSLPKIKRTPTTGNRLKRMTLSEVLEQEHEKNTAASRGGAPFSPRALPSTQATDGRTACVGNQLPEHRAYGSAGAADLSCTG